MNTKLVIIRRKVSLSATLSLPPEDGFSSIGDSTFQQQRATENINDGLLATDSGDIAVDTGMLNYNEAGLNLTALCEGFHHQVAATRIIISSKAAEPAARTRGK